MIQIPRQEDFSRLLWKIVSNQQVLYEETHQLSLALLLSKKKTSTYTSDGYLHLHAKKDSIFLSRIYIHLCMSAKLFVRIKAVQCVPWCSTILRFSES